MNSKNIARSENKHKFKKEIQEKSERKKSY